MKTIHTALLNELLKACRHRGVKPKYEEVQRYAEKYKKYNNLSIHEIGLVVKSFKNHG